MQIIYSNKNKLKKRIYIISIIIKYIIMYKN
jgi:hypothetical protein